ncbi:MAG: tRNA (uridine(34)/cytosine(34)/5-carboxymethylaminomethyluridine(34)-2'-O)-methyltransferase TrmL [Candidatus Coproplasma sp.]
MFNIVLVEPEIPQNTGNIARTCAATGCTLHLVKPLGFEISDKYLKRAGLDYWQYVDVKIWENIEELFAAYPGGNFYFFTTKGRHRHDEARYKKGDFLVFGKETKGLPEELLVEHEETCVRIPMLGDLRSLNLSNSVAIAVYEGLRQNDFEGFNEVGQLHRLKWKE